MKSKLTVFIFFHVPGVIVYFIAKVVSTFEIRKSQ